MVLSTMCVELSRETVGNIVKKLLHTAETFKTRPLIKCSVVYLDETYFPLKRKYADGKAYIEKECIEVAIGITETVHRETKTIKLGESITANIIYNLAQLGISIRYAIFFDIRIYLGIVKLQKSIYEEGCSRQATQSDIDEFLG